MGWSIGTTVAKPVHSPGSIADKAGVSRLRNVPLAPIPGTSVPAGRPERHGWRVLESVDEAGLAAGEGNAPGLEQALRALERAEANALVAAKRERLDRALLELAALLASAQQQG